MRLQAHDLILSALLLVSSIGIFTWWSVQLHPLNNVSWTAIPPDIPGLPSFDDPQLSTSHQTVERPLFWESRRPLSPQASTTAQNAPPVPMELLGIVTEGDKRVALLRPLQGTQPFLVYRLHQSESHNGMVVQNIGRDRVTIGSTSGMQTLTIQRGSKNPGFKLQPAKPSEPQFVEATPAKLTDTKIEDPTIGMGAKPMPPTIIKNRFTR